MNTKEKIERLAEIRSIIKPLEEEAKGIQTELIDDGHFEKFRTEYGTLTPGKRETWECLDNSKIFNTLTLEEFLAVSSVSVSEFAKQQGKAKADKLKAGGVFSLKSVSKYFSLRK